MKLDTSQLRKLSVEFHVDPRSIQKEQSQPGSVRGDAGHRVRAALQAFSEEHGRLRLEQFHEK